MLTLAIERRITQREIAKEPGLGGKVKRRYEVAKTPYQRLIESNQIPEEAGEELKGRYLSLNPTELKRNIGAKLAEPHQAHEKKKRAQHVDPRNRLVLRMVRYL